MGKHGEQLKTRVNIGHIGHLQPGDLDMDTNKVEASIKAQLLHGVPMAKLSKRYSVPIGTIRRWRREVANEVRAQLGQDYETFAASLDGRPDPKKT